MMINKDKLKPVVVEAENGNQESIAVVREVLRPLKTDSVDEIVEKIGLFIRLIFIASLNYKDSKHHKQIDRAYAEQIHSYLNTNRPRYKGMAFIGYRESAKRQPLTAKLMTPDGYKQLGSLNVGDDVIGADGKPTKIVYMSPIVKRPIYELTTQDNRKTECDNEHLWTIRRMSNHNTTKYETISTQEMLDRGLFYERKADKRNNKKYNEYKFALETVKSVELNAREQIVEPYFLGIWLGDGTSSCQHITNIDTEVEEYIEGYAKRLNLKYRKRTNKERTQTLIISGIAGVENPLKKKLKEIGVLNNKHIPDNYLYGSIEQRKALLEGLMDSDGTVSSGTASFSNKNERIIDGVVSLVRSLGGRATKSKSKTYCMYKGNKKECVYWRISILFTNYTPFRLPRKIKNHKLSNSTFSRIVSIEYLREDFGRCIRVANEDGLYVTDDYLLTHNTSRVKFNESYLTLYLENIIDFTTVISEDGSNADQFNMDMFNTLAFSRIAKYYPSIISLEQKKKKESQTISKFTTITGVTYTSSSARKTRRGAVKVDVDEQGDVETKRPKKVIFDDIENETTVMSAVISSQIHRVMNATIDGLDQTSGSWILIGNYLSLRGNVAKFINKYKDDDNYFVLLLPIIDGLGQPTWEGKYVRTDKEERELSEQGITRVSIETIQRESDNFDTEYLNNPSRSSVYFDDDSIESLDTGKFIGESARDEAGLLTIEEPDKQSVYVMSVDCAKGNKGDQSAFTIIKTNGTRYEEVANFYSNTISPEKFAPYSSNIARKYNNCLIIPENNYPGNEYIAFLSPIYNNIFISEKTIVDGEEKVVYGVNTNLKTKPEMFINAKKILASRLFIVNSQILFNQFAEYPKQDINTIKQKDGSGGHWDILQSCFVKNTMILTDKGQRPIQDLKIGDMVLTRQGYKPIIASVAQIKEVITNIGLTGTADHPIFYADDKCKDLSGVRGNDILYVWDSKQQKIERISYTEALTIIDTQIPHIETTVCTLSVEQSGRSRLWHYIAKFGLIVLGKFQKVFIYTTRTATHLIITLAIWSLYLLQSICTVICKVLKGKKYLGKAWLETEKRLTRGLQGQSKTGFSLRRVVLFVERSSQRFLNTLSIVQVNVDTNLKTIKDEKSRQCTNAQSAKRNISHAILHKNTVLNPVIKSGKNKYTYVLFPMHGIALFVGRSLKRLVTMLCTVQAVAKIKLNTTENNYQEVFNIQVADCPEYFANNILVHNCVIGLWKAGVIGLESGKYDIIDLILNESINKVFKGQENNK